MSNVPSFRSWIGFALLWSGGVIAEELFYPAETCGFCHSSGSGALVDEEGEDVSIWREWSGSMMANAFKDPLFRAKIASEVKRTPELKKKIEDKCTRCHTPMGRTQWYHDGHRDYGLAQTHDSELADDGVSCALCHQIQPDHLGSRRSFSGGYVIEAKREIYGPYQDVFTGPMRNHLDYTPMFGAQIGESELCGSCHVLFTPIVDANGGTHGEFPEQATYLEWRNSAYAKGDTKKSCLDCHADRAVGAVKITRRPPWYQVKREPFSRHTFNGGNRFVLGMLRDEARQQHDHAAESELTEAMGRTEELLKEAVTIEIIEAKVEDEGVLKVKVAVENLTGHKLPTGYPSRRMWVRLEVRDVEDRTLWESGGWNAAGEISGLDEPYEPHHDLIDGLDQVQVYETVMADVSGAVTHTLLRAASYLKDNRLVPLGFQSDGPFSEFTAVAGEATADANFNRADDIEGTGRDVIEYRIPVSNAAVPLRVDVELLYQTVSSGFMGDLLSEDTREGREFERLYRRADKRPVLIQRASQGVD